MILKLLIGNYNNLIMLLFLCFQSLTFCYLDEKGPTYQSNSTQARTKPSHLLLK